MASELTQRRIDSLLDDAEEAISQLDWQVVQSRAQAIVLDPANPDAINYLAATGRALSGSISQPNSQPATTPQTASALTPDHERFSWQRRRGSPDSRFPAKESWDGHRDVLSNSGP